MATPPPLLSTFDFLTCEKIKKIYNHSWMLNQDACLKKNNKHFFFSSPSSPSVFENVLNIHYVTSGTCGKLRPNIGQDKPLQNQANDHDGDKGVTSPVMMHYIRRTSIRLRLSTSY